MYRYVAKVPSVYQVGDALSPYDKYRLVDEVCEASPRMSDVDALILTSIHRYKLLLVYVLYNHICIHRYIYTYI